MLVGGVALAADDDRMNRIRFGVNWTEPSGAFQAEDFDSNGPLVWDFSAALEPQGAPGVFLSYERMAGDIFGVEIGIRSSNHDIDATGTSVLSDPGGSDTVTFSGFTISDVQVTPLTLGGNFHFGQKADIYGGIFVQYTMFSDLKDAKLPSGVESHLEQFISGPEKPRGALAGQSLAEEYVGTIEFDDDINWGFQFGVDWPFGTGAWALNGGLRYALTTLKEKDCQGDCFSLEIDPWSFNVGIAYRF
jgi:outer membrane protein W